MLLKPLLDSHHLYSSTLCLFSILILPAKPPPSSRNLTPTSPASYFTYPSPHLDILATHDMSQPALSPSLTLLDSEPTHEQPESPATAPSNHPDETEITHKGSSSVTPASDHFHDSDDAEDTASTHEEPSSPVTAPSDQSDDAVTPADSADTKVSPTKDEGKGRRPLSKVQELAAWYDSQTNGNLRLQVLTWDGRAVDAPKNKAKKSKKTSQAAVEAEQDLM